MSKTQRRQDEEMGKEMMGSKVGQQQHSWRQRQT